MTSDLQASEILALYEDAVKQTRGFVAAVRPEQLRLATPCTEWNVQKLLDHIVELPGFYAGILTGRRPTLIAPGSGSLETFDSATTTLIQTSKQPGVLARKFSSPQGSMSGAQFLLSAFLDMLIHGWDLAYATGQDTDLDPDLVDAAYELFAPHMEGLRPSGAFGVEVPVAPNAGRQDRLLAIMGRQA
ncbi:MAG: TIGR03086 family protein [SAR202 cluster bacterium]|nr:TIGR03086 family protein [SAR202 cluster bacterium]